MVDGRHARIHGFSFFLGNVVIACVIILNKLDSFSNTCAALWWLCTDFHTTVTVQWLTQVISLPAAWAIPFSPFWPGSFDPWQVPSLCVLASAFPLCAFGCFSSVCRWSFSAYSRVLRSTSWGPATLAVAKEKKERAVMFLPSYTRSSKVLGKYQLLVPWKGCIRI